MALHLYRRHRTTCPHRSATYRRCSCPIHVRGTLGGERIRLGLDQTSWDAAQTTIAAWVNAGRVDPFVDKTKTIKDAVTAFLVDAKERGLAPATLGKYTLLLDTRLVTWSAAHGYKTVDSLDLDALSRFRATWTGGALAKSKTQERLRSFFKWCAARKWTADNPAAGLSQYKITPSPTLPLDDSEVRAILAACDRYSTAGKYGRANRDRLRAFVLVLRWTGLRIRDVVTLTTNDVQPGRVFVYTQKTGTPVWCPVPPAVTEALDRVPKHGVYFFWSGKGLAKSAVADWQRSLRKLFALADVPEAHAHRFRDTFAVELLLKGVPIEDVSILLGHSSIKITQAHYAPWVSARQSRLEAAVRQTWQDAPTPPAAESADTPVQPPMPESEYLSAHG